MYSNDDERQIKVCLLGDQAVGKSCTACRFVSNTFTNVEPTVGASYMARTITVNSKSYKIQIWDTAGQEKYRNLAPMYYRGAAAALLVFDITHEDSFESMNSWIDELKDMGPSDILIVLAGNKSDLHHQRKVSTEQAAKFAEDHGITYFETSAKTSENVEEIFRTICERVPDKVPRSYTTPIATDTLRINDKVKTKEKKNKSGCC